MIKKLKKICQNLLSIEKKIKDTDTFNYLKYSALNSNERGINKNNFKNKIVISLTTYSKRIEEVYLVVESILNQTLKADKIILWLDEVEFNEEIIPNILKKQRERGLEIKYCENIKSYKKLIPTLKEYSNEIIITVDDDIIYPIDFIEKLYKNHIKFPNVILCNIGREIPKNKKLILEYKNWKLSKNIKLPMYEIVPIGAGGILYPPNCFYKDVQAKELFQKLAPLADDIWFKTMTLKNGLKSMVIDEIDKYLKQIIVLEEAQDIALYKKNIKMNNIQIKKVFEKYDILNLDVLNID